MTISFRSAVPLFRVLPFLRATLCLCICAGACASDLRIGFKLEVSAADPHVPYMQNRNVWLHVYESLVGQDESLRPVPMLATRWRMTDPLTWEFTLRPQVRFHDGSPLTAEDVRFSIERARNLGGPRTFRTYLKDVDTVLATGPLTVVIKTRQFSPSLPVNLALISIVPRSTGNSGEEAFASGKAAIGTGPYRFVEWKQGHNVVLARNDGYWGTKEPWSKVSFEFLPKEPVRATALMSGSVDVIDFAPSTVTDAFKVLGSMYEVTSTTSYMLNYIQLDRFRENSPYIKGINDRPLPRNPFNDPRVRQAFMLAIDRSQIARSVMKGDAEATAQIVPAGFFGYDPSLRAEPANPAKARALLSDAGYPGGFKLTLHCTNDRYLNDAKVCEAVGRMLTDVGIRTTVQTLPGATFLARATSGGTNGDPEFSAFMLGIGAASGESLTPLLAVAHTHDPKAGTGANNRGRYSNKELDALIAVAGRTLDAAAREQALQAAARLNVADVGIVPLQHLKSSWAHRRGLRVKARSDGFTLAMNIRESGAP